MNMAIVVITGFLILILYLGIRSKSGKKMNMEQWAVGGRGFGSIFVFLLMAGELYSTFTFLGASGLAYSQGAASFYVIGYISLGAVLSYFLLPPIWRYAKEHNIISSSEFFSSKYKSPALGVLVTLVGVLALIPYVVLQFKGLGIIVSETSYGQISPTVAIVIGMISLVIYVLNSGIHGSAWNAAVKDILILFVVIFIGIYLPFHHYGGFQPMFEAVYAAKPELLTLSDKGMSASWFISTVIVSSFAVYMWPHALTATFSSKEEIAFRRYAILTPLYLFVLIFIFVVGFTAMVKVPGLEGVDGDLALLRISIQTFDPWFVGVIGAAGMFCAIIPGSMMLLSAASMLSKNIYVLFDPTVTDEKITNITKVFVCILSVICLFFALSKASTLTTLFITATGFMAQLFPTAVFSLFKNNFITKQGAFVGILIGVCTTLYMAITETTMATLFPTMPSFVQDLNISLVALCINVVLMVVVSMFTRKKIIVQEETEKPISSNLSADERM